jgi:septin family protein
MKRLGSRVNLIPVIAKADTLTPSDLAKFKQNVKKKKKKKKKNDKIVLNIVGSFYITTIINRFER